MQATVAFGQAMRRAREQRGWSRQQLSSITSIPLKDIEAIEAGLFLALPLGMYRRAEIRAYAEAVGFDPASTVGEFHRVLSSPTHAKYSTHTKDPRDTKDWNNQSRRDLRDLRRVRRATVRHVPPVAPLKRSMPVLALAFLGVAALALIGGAAPDRQSEPQSTTVTTMSPLGLGLQVANPFAEADETHRKRMSTAKATLSNALFVTPTIVGREEPRPQARAPRRGPVLVVRTRPSGARVTVNGIGRGETPVTVRYLPPGAWRVRVVNDGFTSEERVVRLDDSGTRRITIPMRRRR